LAERVDGIDLSRYKVGDLIELPQRDAEILIAEEWATAVAAERRCGLDRRASSSPHDDDGCSK